MLSEILKWDALPKHFPLQVGLPWDFMASELPITNASPLFIIQYRQMEKWYMETAYSAKSKSQLENILGSNTFRSADKHRVLVFQMLIKL